MATVRTKSVRAALAAMLWIIAGSAVAQPQRVFVASYGIDTSPCTRAQPCRTFATAVTVVADGGEVIPLDSAGYGSVHIFRPVSIVVPPNVVAWINSTDGYGISINAPGQVTIRGLRVATVTSAAIYIESTGVLIADCVASSESDAALRGVGIVTDSTFADSAYGIIGGGVLNRVNVLNNVNDGIIGGGALSGVTVAGNGGNGLYVPPPTSGFAHVNVTNSTIANNGGHGVLLHADDGGGEVFSYVGFGISDSAITGNGGYGINSAWVNSGLATIDAAVSGNLIADNAAAGVFLVDGGYTGLLTANTISRNGTAGIEGGARTRGNNAILQALPVSGVLVAVPGY